MGIYERFKKPDGMPIAITKSSNQGSMCTDCKSDLELVASVNNHRDTLISLLGEACYAASYNSGSRDSRGIICVAAEAVTRASSSSEIMGAVSAYDDAENMLEASRHQCTGAEGFNKDGQRMVFCPKNQEDYLA